MSTNAKAERAIQLAGEIIPNFDRKVKTAVSDILRGSAGGIQHLIQEAEKAGRSAPNTPQMRELIRLGKDLAQGKR